MQEFLKAILKHMKENCMKKRMFDKNDNINIQRDIEQVDKGLTDFSTKHESVVTNLFILYLHSFGVSIIPTGDITKILRETPGKFM